MNKQEKVSLRTTINDSGIHESIIALKTKLAQYILPKTIKASHYTIRRELNETKIQITILQNQLEWLVNQSEINNKHNN